MPLSSRAGPGQDLPCGSRGAIPNVRWSKVTLPKGAILDVTHRRGLRVDKQLEGLEPVVLWKHFDEILRIPHCSKHEKRVREYVRGVAEKLDLECEEDKAGNVIVRKGATEERKEAPTVVLQGHLDMVCEKNAGTEHDFDKDPIEPRLDGDLLFASGTTLGADNGIGVATALAVLEASDIAHGPIEALFTVDEETGLTGAFELKDDFISGRIMLNLDSEDMGVVTIGCAGGGDSHISIAMERVPIPPDRVMTRVKVEGLRGGHSGVDIHEDRANAVKLLTRVLWEARDSKYLLVDIEGGDKHNAIPREASAVVVGGPTEMKRLKEKGVQCQEAFLAEYGGRDGGIAVTVEDAGAPEGMAATIASTRRAVSLLMALPHGVEKYSHDIHGLVETSTNLAAVRIEEGRLVALHSTRSSIASALEALRGRIESAACLAGAEVEHKMSYPGWKPNPGSELLGITKEVHKELFGSEPEVEAIHAGLETGIVGEKFPGMDMVSIGPTIKNPHSPEEHVDVKTVAEFWRWVTALLDKLSS
jgi:dipeptidase D